MREIFRWIDKEGGVHEYRFEDNICEGFFSNGVEGKDYKGKVLTDTFREGLEDAGFKIINS